ncbi:galactose-specific lectin nattectin-like [Cyprinodon tularosa]|uniref:galactose-specific lectin nattectin-like n=1 Tax=Cyprinodon tularosa TaxID=77115 RepID=UPI0018E203F4|nr:galactose-specific lectin nattectin-like [Cyprinodon tularosa]
MASGFSLTLLLGLSFGLWAEADAECRLRAATTGDCPPEWSWYENRCFHFVEDKKSWADAESHCLSVGGNLASFQSKGEYNFIRDLVHKESGQKNTWVGAHDAVKEGFWMWSDGAKFGFAP